MTHQRLRSVLVAASTCLLAATGCSVDPTSIPVPGTQVSGPTYRIRIEFANALNLPAQAKVVANGARVGTLRDVTVVDPQPHRPGHVIADIDISTSVRLPGTTTAQLRQNTILGDIYIGLSTPAADTGPPLEPGQTITLPHTEPALQIEDLLAGISTFVTGGAVQRFQDIVDRTNAMLPASTAETARIVDVLGKDTQDVAANLEVNDRFLDAVHSDLDAVLDNRAALNNLLSERGAVEVPADANSLIQTLGVIGSMGVIAESALWLGPFLQASDASAKALVPLFLGERPLDLTTPSNMNRLTALLRDKIIPFAEHGPKVNIARVRAEPAPDRPVGEDVQIDRIIAVLRMIGIVR